MCTEFPLTIGIAGSATRKLLSFTVIPAALPALLMVGRKSSTLRKPGGAAWNTLIPVNGTLVVGLNYIAAPPQPNTWNICPPSPPGPLLLVTLIGNIQCRDAVTLLQFCGTVFLMLLFHYNYATHPHVNWQIKTVMVLKGSERL